ncbi:DNA replication protein psf1, partial [Ascosphaera atra]
VQHAKRTQTLPQLPPCQTELVRAVVREVRELDNENKRTIIRHTADNPSGGLDPTFDQGVACALLVNHLFMRRNKRCLLAYHRVRTQKLEELAWRGGALLDEQQMQAQVGDAAGRGKQSSAAAAADVTAGRVQNVDALSPEEEDYFRQYNDMLMAYKGQWSDVDLTGSLVPPKELFVDVRVLKDAGDIQTEYGYAKKV